MPDGLAGAVGGVHDCLQRAVVNDFAASDERRGGGHRRGAYPGLQVGDAVIRPRLSGRVTHSTRAISVIAGAGRPSIPRVRLPHLAGEQIEIAKPRAWAVLPRWRHWTRLGTLVAAVARSA